MTEYPTEKRCSMCGEIKPASSFSRNGKHLRSACKPCHSAHRRARHAENPEKLREQKRRWIAENRERRNEQQRVSYLRHREKRLADMRRYRLTYEDPRGNERMEIKARALDHYSAGDPKCSCCGETTRGFLGLTGLDELDRQMTQAMLEQRLNYVPKMMAGKIWPEDRPYRCQLYEWMEHEGWPVGPRVLCHNCRYAEQHAGVCPHQEEPALPSTVWQQRKAQALRHYSGGRPQCSCCGVDEIAFLMLNRIGGYSEEERDAGINHHVYHYVTLNGYPDGYRVLCRNCQLTTKHRGVCAHEDPDACDPWQLAKSRRARRQRLQGDDHLERTG